MHLYNICSRGPGMRGDFRGVGSPNSRAWRAGGYFPRSLHPEFLFYAAGERRGKRGESIPTVAAPGIFFVPRGGRDRRRKPGVGVFPRLLHQGTRRSSWDPGVLLDHPLPAICPYQEYPVDPFCRYPAPYRGIAQFVGKIAPPRALH